MLEDMELTQQNVRNQVQYTKDFMFTINMRNFVNWTQSGVTRVKNNPHRMTSESKLVSIMQGTKTQGRGEIYDHISKQETSCNIMDTWTDMVFTNV
jgi:hypothetical protein